VARHLLYHDGPPSFDVQAMTRDPSSEAAQRLGKRGAEVVQGDLDDPASFRPLVRDADAAFFVSNFWKVGYDRQVEHGTTFAEVADEEGLDQLVFSSVGSADQGTGIPHFDSVAEVEETVDDLGVPRTFLRPVFFFQNLEPSAEDITGGTLAQPLAEGVPLQMIDVDDVGRVAAQVLADPDTYVGEARDLAGDELTLEEAAGVFSEVVGSPVEPYHVPIDEAREAFGDEFATMFEWFNQGGYSADIADLEEEFGPFTDLRSYLEENGWSGGREEPATLPGWA
jgi:uncharacterized protein YbjT (DUF2867 family)